MRNLVLIITFLSICNMYSQSRNTNVRKLNRIIEFMNESSRANMNLYDDIRLFSNAYILHSEKGNRRNWYSRIKPRPGKDWFEFEIRRYRQLEEEMRDLQKTSFFRGKERIKNTFEDFQKNIDSLVVHHRFMWDYINAKAYMLDENDDFEVAKNAIRTTENILDEYHRKSANLYSEIEIYYKAHYKPYKTKKQIRDAEAELRKTINLMRHWEDDLWKGNSEKNKAYDATLNALHDEAMTKDSIYLSRTYGFKERNHGAMPHTRYCQFYRTMKSTLRWYANDRRNYRDYPYIKERDINYNEFVDHAHRLIESYNNFIECADGRQYAKNLDYSMQQAKQVGADMNENVLLGFPRWGYLFHFKSQKKPKPRVEAIKLQGNQVSLSVKDSISPVKDSISPVKDLIISKHQSRINNASPHHMVYLLDASGSMSRPGKLDLLKEGAKYLVSLQRKSDHISILSFSTHAQIMTQYITCDKKLEINHTLDKLQARGFTNINEGIKEAFSIIENNRIPDEVQKIILVTDGKFLLNNVSKKIITSFNKEKIELCILWMGDQSEKATEREFRKLCRDGNGRLHKVNHKNLQDILVKEASE